MIVDWEYAISEFIALFLAGIALAITLPIGYFLALRLIEKWEDFLSWFYGDIPWGEEIVPLGGKLFTSKGAGEDRIWHKDAVGDRIVTYVGMGEPEGLLNKPSAHISVSKDGKRIVQIKIPEGQSGICEDIKIRVKGIFKQKDYSSSSALIALYLPHTLFVRVRELLLGLVKRK